MKDFDKTKYDLVEDVDVRSIRKGDVIALRGVPKVGLLVRSRSGCTTLKIGDAINDYLYWSRLGWFDSTGEHPFDIIHYYTPKKEIDWASLARMTPVEHAHHNRVYYIAPDPTDDSCVIVSKVKRTFIAGDLRSFSKNLLGLTNA